MAFSSMYTNLLIIFLYSIENVQQFRQFDKKDNCLAYSKCFRTHKIIRHTTKDLNGVKNQRELIRERISMMMRLHCANDRNYTNRRKQN